MILIVENGFRTFMMSSSRDGRGSYFFHGGGRAGRGKAKNLRGGAGKESKPAGQGTYWVYQLIEIICHRKGNLNLHCIK